MDVGKVSDFHNQLMQEMSEFDDSGNPKVGIFWYSPKEEELFGVQARELDSEELKSSKRVHYKRLHKDVWKKEHFRAIAKKREDSPFLEYDYTKVPRGRVYYEDSKMYVMVGDWINDKSYLSSVSHLRDLLKEEFDLPDDFELKLDEHWNIGHDWSEENL